MSSPGGLRPGALAIVLAAVDQVRQQANSPKPD